MTVRPGLVEANEIPGGTMLGFGRNPIKTLMDASAKYGDVCYIKWPRSRFLLVNNPEIIQKILTVEYRNFVKGAYFQRTRRLLGEGLLTSEGELHHRDRRLVLPAFHQQMINNYADTMVGFASRLMAGWHDGDVRDIHREMSSVTLAVVAKTLFSEDVDMASNEVAELLNLAVEYYDKIAHPFGALGNRLKLPNYNKYLRAEEKLNRLAYRIVKDRRRSGEDKGDMLSMLLKAEEMEGSKMTDKQVRDETITFFLVGHETTAAALTWTWYLLSQNPIVEQKLHGEVDRLLPGDRMPGPGDFPKLEYTTKVMTETLRMYPPVWAFGRMAVNECELGGFQIPARTAVVISQYLTQRDSRFFTRPHRFDPDRWTPEMKKKLPKYAYFPFGGGPRACVGEPFAWMEGTLLLAAFARKWSFSHVPENRVILAPRITLRPKNGMMMKLAKRG